MDVTVEVVAFFVFAVMTLGGGLMVVLDRNLFHAALFLLLSLFGVAGLLVLLVAPFLAAIQVLVYMGAIAILIVMAIMLTRGMMQMEQSYNTQYVAGAVVAALIFVALLVALWPSTVDWPAEEDVPAVEYETVAEIGRVIASRDGFVLPFEVASVLLTAAMIGAIVVAREDEA